MSEFGSDGTSDKPDSLDATHCAITTDSLRTSDGVCDHGRMAQDRSPQPPSQRVEADLRRRIAADEWQSEQRLPPVAELAKFYGVARSTVIAALRRIEADGLIQIVANWGTFRR